MAFYFKPPRGNIALYKLTNCVHQRFQYLSSLLEGHEHYKPENYEYLITGSAMDRAGHYMLRLLSISRPQVQEFVVKAEVHLFVMRLGILNNREILMNLKAAHRHVYESLTCIKCSKEFQEFLLNMNTVFQRINYQQLVDHVFDKCHALECEQYVIEIPFTMCLPLVRQRRVSLKKGMAKVPCGVWTLFLHELFEMHMILGMKEMVNSGCFQKAWSDHRIRRLSKDLERILGNETYEMPSLLKASEVDTASTYFPLCMVHLLQVLRSRHRLSYAARRLFTLFLKDIGMSVQEAVKFWRIEYSQRRNENTQTHCCHSWQKDGHRYLYSIRHMYGLEGGRYNYHVPSCASIQVASLKPSSEEGCPFKHFAEEKIIKYFLPELLKDTNVLNRILQLKEINPKQACQTYLLFQKAIVLQMAETLEKETGEPQARFSNPAHYYMSLTNYL